MKKTLAWVKNYLGNKFYPYTHIDAVFVDNEEQKKLAETISEFNNRIDLISKKQSDWNESNIESGAYIKNKPLSLPANGGNSDTLEGKHASDFTENSIFEAHLTDNVAHQNLFDSKLNIESANKLIKNISSDASTGIVTVTRQDNTTFTINIPKSLIFQSAIFNEQSNEIIITWNDNSESRIPVEGLVDVYVGSESDSIQIVVDDNNIISANIKEGSISIDLLSADIQNSLNASHSHSNSDILDSITSETILNIQTAYNHVPDAKKHIPDGGILGQFIGKSENGIEWVDINITSNDYTDEEKDKLSNIEDEANKYIHPDSHPATMIAEDEMHQFVTAEEKALIGTSNFTEISFNEATSELTIGDKKIDLSSLKTSDALNGGGEITPGFNMDMLWKTFNTDGMTIDRVDYLNEKFVAIGGTCIFYGDEFPLQKVNLQDIFGDISFTLINVHFYVNRYYIIGIYSDNGNWNSYIFATEDLKNYEVKILNGQKVLGLYYNGSDYIILNESDKVYVKNVGKWETGFDIDNSTVVLETPYLKGFINWIVTPTVIAQRSASNYISSNNNWETAIYNTDSQGNFFINKAQYKWIRSTYGNRHYYILKNSSGSSNIVWNYGEYTSNDMKFSAGALCNGKFLLIFGGDAVLINSFDELTAIVDNGYKDVFTICTSDIKFIEHNYKYIAATTDSGDLIYAEIS